MFIDKLYEDMDTKNYDAYIVADKISFSLVDQMLKWFKTCNLVTSSTQTAVFADYLCKARGWRDKGFKLSHSIFTVTFARNEFFLIDTAKKICHTYIFLGDFDWNTNLHPTPPDYGVVTSFISSLAPTKTDGVDSASIIATAVGTNIPLFTIDKKSRRKKAPEISGVNWGCRNGNSDNTDPIAAYIPITTSTITRNSFFIPAQSVAVGDAGKENYFVDLIWDDGIIMPAVFRGKGRVINGIQYPKMLTSRDNGAAMGKYFRKRLGIKEQDIITYKTFSFYGRDDLDLMKLAENIYYANFSL